MNIALLLEARALLCDVTPLKEDCGLLCGHACCAPDADGQGGVLLLPGEETLSDCSWGHVESGMLVCDSFCARHARPFNCRLFPLVPAKRKDGTWDVRMDRRSSALCPLFRAGVRGLDPTFVENARHAVRLLAQDMDYEAFMTAWSRAERRFAQDMMPL